MIRRVLHEDDTVWTPTRRLPAAADLYRVAEAALYKAKQGGRNCVR